MSRPLTVQEAAERIGISDTAVRQLCQSGKLRHRRVGARRGRIRIDEQDLLSYLEAAVREPGCNSLVAKHELRIQTEGYGILRKYGYQP
ncbi:MAG: helix-turn-helix domain-containing protein [Pirellulaceae bacterium]